jgi:hypothetical protein
MVSVELIYDPDCPNVPHVRAALLKAFDQADIPPAWIEWDRQSADSAAHVRGYGSPTILVDGRDVAGITPGDGASSCRLYRSGSGAFAGAPDVAQIAQALLGSHSPLGPPQSHARHLTDKP